MNSYTTKKQFFLACSGLTLMSSLLMAAEPSSAPVVMSGHPAPLPGHAAIVEATTKGLQAVKDGQPSIASRYFAEAFLADPADPTMMFNVGLAHARAGRPTAALCWFEAALAKDPALANAEAIRAEIARLESVLVAQSQDLMARAAKGCDTLDEKLRVSVARDVASGFAVVGDLEAAARYDAIAEPTKAADRAERLEIVRLTALLYYGFGPIDEVLAGIEKLAPSPAREDLVVECASALANANRLAEASNLARSLPEEKRQKILNAIAGQYRSRGEPLAVSELLPQLNASDRSVILLWDSQDLIAKGDLNGARILIDRMDDPDRCSSTKMLLLLPLLRAGREADARSIAKQLLSAARIHEHGEWGGSVAEWVSPLLVLGNYELALSSAPYADFSSGFRMGGEQGSGREYLYGEAILIAGLRGEWALAKDIERAFTKIPPGKYEENERPWHPGWPAWGYAMAYAWRGQPDQAMSHFRTLHPRIQAEPMTDIVTAYLANDNAAGAETVVWAVNQQQASDPNHFGGYGSTNLDNLVTTRMRCLRTIAEHVADKPSQAQRLLIDASHLPQWTTLSCLFSASIRAELQTVAAAQERFGDASGATATRRLDLGETVTGWISNAIGYSEESDLESTLREAVKDAKPEEVPGRIARVAEDLIKRTYNIRGIRRRLAMVK